jgi:hypothetical protein
MRRTLAALAVVAVLVSLVGCRICANPYDYCQPVFTGENCQECVADGRAGSVLTSCPLPPFAEASDGVAEDETYESTPELNVPSPGGPNSLIPTPDRWSNNASFQDSLVMQAAYQE